MRVLRLIIFLLILLIIPFHHCFAQNNVSLGVATYVPISDKVVQNGSIVSASSTGFNLSTKTYDPLMFGVVTENPAVSFGEGNEVAKYPVISSGQAYVLVNGENGNIKRGDLITSSTTPGVGMKAVKSGYIVGTSLADGVFTTKKESKLLPLSLNVNFYSTKKTAIGNITDIFNFSLLAASDEPIAVFKYIVAFMIIILSFVLGMLSFGKIATNGIEALGRNPLAARMIEVGIIFNVFITIAIIGAGIVMALFIIRI